MTGRVGKADQALAVPATPANAVDGPPGFDPSRMTDAEAKAQPWITDEAEPRWLYVAGTSSVDHDAFVAYQFGDHPKPLWIVKSCGYVCGLTEGFNSEARITARPAIATEAGTATTTEIGVVHEGAGRNAALPENKPVNPYALGGGK